ncbi:MAG: hypothetical protein ABIB04_02255 [Patescibacteria group bacterium]
MIKKISSFVLVLSLAVAFGAGCNKNKSQDQTDTGLENKGIFASIKDAFDKSIAVRCDYTDDDGGETITYIKNKRIYLESEPQGTADGKTVIIHGLVRDDKMYIWGDENDKGIIFDFTTISGEPPKMGGKEIHGTQDIIDKLEEKKDKCKTESIGDDKFELPSKIEFVSF